MPVCLPACSKHIFLQFRPFPVFATKLTEAHELVSRQSLKIVLVTGHPEVRGRKLMEGGHGGVSRAHEPFIIVQWLSRVWLFVTPWTAARQASLSFTISQSLLRFMSTVSVMLSNHLILCWSVHLCNWDFLQLHSKSLYRNGVCVVFLLFLEIRNMYGWMHKLLEKTSPFIRHF